MWKSLSSLPSLRWSRCLASSRRLEVLLELLLGEEGRAVDALELLVVLVALPVGAGDGEELEGAGLDLARGGDVRPAAEVVEGALPVDGDGLVLAPLEGQLGLVGLLLLVEEGLGLLPGHLFAADGGVAGDDLVHPPLDGLQVLEAEGHGAVEIVVEPVLDDGPDGDLGLREQLLDRVGEEVRAGVAVDRQGLGGPVRDELHARRALEGDVDVHQLPVHLGRQAGRREAGRDALAHLEGRGALGEDPGGSVGKGDLNLGQTTLLKH